jgi:Rrf2 family transcriptional regulator, iron-sulfur cluster assembly transcription factor
MKINTKIRYGLRTMIEIAYSGKVNGVLQKDIASKQEISLKYLDSIISSLKLKGLIVSQKGKGSGYMLARPAEEITMLDIYTAFDPIVVIECINNREICDLSQHCMAQCYWNGFKLDLIEILQKKTLAYIINECKPKSDLGNMFEK